MKFLQISIPKAGTHLFENMTLAQTANLPLAYGGIDQMFPSELYIRSSFLGLKADERYKAHLPYFAGVESLLEQFDYVIFILRDPRDIIVSMAHYIENAPESVFNWYIDGELLSRRSMEYRLDYLIDNMRPVFARFDPWMDIECVDKFRYEDYARNPGDVYRRLSVRGFGTIGELEKRAAIKAYTFRVGTIGNWKGEFSNCQKKRANNNFSDFLERWGYDKC